MLTMFSVYDEKADAYITPFFLPTIGLATRTFMDCVTDPNHAFGRHAEDYTLIALGTFDPATAELRERRQVVITGLEARAQARVFDESQGELEV